MNEHDILERVSSAKQNFGANCKKYAGAVTAELIRQALLQKQIPASARDVYIKGIPFEIDLLIAKHDAQPENGLLYKPEDVLLVLEIKKSGVFSKDGVVKIKQCFCDIQEVHSTINCIYITLSERQTYIHAVTEGKLGYPAFTLFFHNGSELNRKYEQTGDWQRFLNYVKSIQ